jgi:phage-related holin
MIKSKMKEFFLKTVIVGFLSYFAEIRDIIHLIIIFSVLDIITGIWKSVILHGWKSFSSRKLRRSIVKIGAYLVAILVSYATDKTLIGIEDTIVLTRLTAGIIGLIEMASLFENLSVITGKKIFIIIFDNIKTYFNRNKDLLIKIDPTLDMNVDTKNESSPEESKTD